MQLKKISLLPVGLPVPSFSKAWAQGKFDDCDYYALSAPVDEWSAAYPTHCLSEVADGICEDGWGIVTWKLTVYVYSSKSMAAKRAELLGGNVKPLKLQCLACFAKVLSTSYTYVDLVLDESWHMESYICREMETAMPGVSHLRLSTPRDYFQLQGCKGNNTLEWIQYPSYGDPNHPTEWCRPMPFPGGMVMHDHTPQGGPMDMEILSDPEAMKYYLVDGVELARDDSDTRDVIFARPIGPVAFANLADEKVRLTSGEGVWIPVAMGEWRRPRWASDYRPYVDKILSGECDAACLVRGSQWHTNRAMALLEQSHIDDDETDDYTRVKVVQQAIEALERAVKKKPWDWYAKTLLRDLRAASPDEVPALIYADRCHWRASTDAMDQLEEEYDAAMAAKPDYHLAMHFRALAYRSAGDNDTCTEGLEQLLERYPQHAQAFFDLGVSAYMDGDEDREMELYTKAIEADPTFAPPYYNIGKTREDNGDIDSAREFYEKALEHNPHYIEAAEQLAGIMWAEGDRMEAVNRLWDNIQSDPLRVATYQNLLGAASELDDERLTGIVMQAFKENLPRAYVTAQRQDDSDA